MCLKQSCFISEKLLLKQLSYLHDEIRDCLRPICVDQFFIEISFGPLFQINLINQNLRLILSVRFLCLISALHNCSVKKLSKVFQKSQKNTCVAVGLNKFARLQSANLFRQETHQFYFNKVTLFLELSSSLSYIIFIV